jgi:hypothetical protein
MVEIIDASHFFFIGIAVPEKLAFSKLSLKTSNLLARNSFGAISQGSLQNKPYLWLKKVRTRIRSGIRDYE